jgi:uroporphyrin-III C-methyltransferase/precorrin-2 dehydrogenase/sirohydrochlorin ferrochelatase
VTGFVSLVGAGPGDPGLVTLKAADRLARAHLVLYDALVSPGALALAGQKARRSPVGKRAGRPAIAQETIHRLMIRAARRGQRVVRLKCGDPFVLGRGGEEALALAAAGVPFEVIPGLTTAVAAPVLSGIPVTHRGLASAFVVVSGHDVAAYRPVLEGLPPGGLTLVVLMGLASRAPIARLLLSRGWRASTPAAICRAAGTPTANTWFGTLGELATASVEGATPATATIFGSGAAGTIVVGEVVSVAGALTARANHEPPIARAAGSAARRRPTATIASPAGAGAPSSLPPALAIGQAR